MTTAGVRETPERERRPLLMATTIDLSALDGPALHLLNLAKALAGLGHSVTVVSPRPRTGIDPYLTTGVRFRHCANAERLGLPGACNVMPLTLALLRAGLRSKTLYLRSGPATLPIAIAARAAGAEGIVAEYNAWLPDDLEAMGYAWPFARAARLMQRAEARQADRIRAVTAGLKVVLAGEGVDARKIAVIGNGTDTARFRPLARDACRRELGIGPDAPVLAFVGNLWPIVDLDSVLEAMALLRQRGRPMRILIAGDGVGRGALEAKARSLLGGDAIFMGHLSPQRTNVLLGATDVAVAPFRRARNARIGLSPLKIRDYAATGRPCVATDLPGIDDLRAEPWMFLARAEEPESYADAVTAALAADRPRAGRRAREYAVEHFDWGIVAERVSDLIA